MAKLKIFIVLVVVYIAYQFYDTFDPESVRGKRVIVTGASTGIGEQLAYEYSKLGAKVLITARRKNVLQKVVAKCKELGAQEAYYIALDMGKLEDTKRLIDEAKTKLGGVDHLILNHITSNYMALWDGNFERLQHQMDVNFRAYVSLATYATPMLNDSSGSIAVVSSFTGKFATPFTAGYTASKFALDGFFSSLRQEYVIQNMDISVTLCVIGSIDTANALEFSKHVIDSSLFYTSASDTAFRIMKGATNREREIYFPWTMTRPTVMLRDFIPNILERLIKSTLKDDAVEKSRS